MFSVTAAPTRLHLCKTARSRQVGPCVSSGLVAARFLPPQQPRARPTLSGPGPSCSSHRRYHASASNRVTTKAHSGDQESGGHPTSGLPVDADVSYLSGVVLDPAALNLAAPGLLVEGYGRGGGSPAAAAAAATAIELMVYTRADPDGPLVAHRCAAIRSLQRQSPPIVAIRAPASLCSALSIQAGSIVDLKAIDSGEIIAEQAGWLRAPPPSAGTLARVVMEGDLYISPGITLTASHFKFRNPVRVRLTIVDQLLGPQMRGRHQPGASYDVVAAVPLGLQAEAGEGVVGTLNFHQNESTGEQYWRLLDGLRVWAKRHGAEAGDAVQLALAVAGIRAIPVGGQDTLVNTIITVRVSKRTTSGVGTHSGAGAAADTVPLPADSEAAPSPSSTPSPSSSTPPASIAPSPSSSTSPASIAPSPSSSTPPASIARPRRAQKRGTGRRQAPSQGHAAAGSDLQKLNSTMEATLGALQRIQALLEQQRAE